MLRALRPDISGCHVYNIIWKPLFDKCFQYLKEPINEVKRNAVDVVLTISNSHCEEKMVDHVNQKSS